MLVASIVLAVLIVGWGSPAFASHVSPTPISSNANCQGLTGIEEIGQRVENPTDGSQTVTIDGVSYTINWDVHTDNTFDWSTSGGLVIYAVFVKGGAGGGGNLYDYRPAGATSDTGLHAPVNPSGQYAGLSHISFCGDVEAPTSTTQATTTQATTTTAGSSSTVASTATSTSQGPTSSVGSQTTQQVIGQNQSTTSSIEDQVLGISFLPFTGFPVEEFGTFALALLAAGVLLLVAARTYER